MFLKVATSRKMGKGLVLMSLLFALLLRPLPVAASASTLHFQGKITNSNGTNLTTGSPICVQAGADTCDLRFSIYSDNTATTLLWRETHNNVEMGDYDGIFSLELNSICQGWTSTSSPNCTISNGGVTFTGNLYYVIEFDPTGAGTFTSPERFPSSGTAEMSSVSQSLSLVGANGESITNNTNGVIQLANNANSNTLSADLTGSSTLSKFLNYADGTNTVSFLSGTQNPQSVATNAGIGSMFLNTSNGNIYVKQDTGSSTNWTMLGNSGTNYWQLNAGVVSPAISSNSLAVGGTATTSAKFLVDGTNGNTTISGGKLAIWDATQSNTAYLKISNATNYVASGNLNGADIVINTQSNGAVQAVRAGLSIDGSSTPTTARALRGELTYNSSGTTGGSEVYTAVGGNSMTNSGNITGVLTAGNLLVTANSGSTVGQLSSSRAFVVTNSGSNQGTINGVFTRVSHGGTSSGEVHAFNGLLSATGNSSGVIGQKLDIRNSASTGSMFGTNTYLENQPGGSASFVFGQNYQIYNNGTLSNVNDNALVFIGSTGGNNGTITGDIIGMGTDVQNGGGAVVNGDIIGHRVLITNQGSANNIYGSKYVFNSYNQATSSAYGIYLGPLSMGTDNNYGVYVATVSGATRNYGVYVETDTKSHFGGKAEFAAATTSNATLNLANSSGTNPSSPVDGDLWWNGTSLNFRAGGSTVDLLTGGATVADLDTVYSNDADKVMTVNNALGLTFNNTSSGAITFQNTGVEALVINATGNTIVRKNLVVNTFADFQKVATFSAATADQASLRIKPSAAINPTAPADGDLWWNGTNLNFRTASSTVDLLGWQNSGAFWQLNAGVLSPGITSNSLAVGGTATSSAKFLVDGTNGNVTTTGNLDVTGNTRVNGNLTIDTFSDFRKIATFSAATADQASLTLLPSSGVNPTTPESGNLWWNGTNLYFYDGSSNRDLLAGGSSPDLDTVYTNDSDKTMTVNDNAGLIFNNTGTGAIAFQNNGVGAMQIDQNRNVMIGSATAEGKFLVQGDFAADLSVGSTIRGLSGGGAYLSIAQDAVKAWAIGMEPGETAFRLVNDRVVGNFGTTALLVDNSNNMTIGGAAADTRLDLEGDFSGVNGIGQVIHGQGTSGSGLSFVQDSVYSWSLGMDVSDPNFTIFNNRNASNAGTAALTIDTNSNVGIGDTNPSFRLDVADTQANSHVARVNNLDTGSSASGLQVQLGFTGLGDTTNRFITFLNGNADIQGRIESDGAGGVTYATGASDFAEYFTKENPDQVMPIGSVVCLGNGGVRLCTAADAGHILGTVSQAPAFLGGKPGPGKVIVALSGQVPLKVTSQGGPIAVGDRVTVATVTGSGQRLATAGYAIGRALTSYDGVSGEATIQIFVHPEYFNPDAAVAQVTPSPTPSVIPTASSSASPEASIFPTDGSTLTASSITVNGLSITGHSIDLNEGTLSLLSGKFTIAQNGNVTIAGDLLVSGALTAKTLTAEQLNLMVGQTPVASISAQGARFHTVLSAESDLEVKGNFKASSRNVGEVRVPAGQQEFRYTFATPFAQPVFLQLTAVDGEENLYKLKDVNESGFTVQLSKSYDTERVFNWFAVEK
jgi:hypothetical protein